MNIDNIIDNVAAAAKKENLQDIPLGAGADPDLDRMPLRDLCEAPFLTDDMKTEIYKRFKAAALDFIEDYTASDECKDTNKNKGMFKCCHESWQACIREWGIQYFKTNKLLHDVKRERAEGGFRLHDDLLQIGLEVYEDLCAIYRKVFQLYDCCLFLGVDKDHMFRLNELHALFNKKAHFAAEASLRIGALTGRGNVTGHAIILNHDYDYTRTTQVIHTTDQAKSAAALPDLSQAQDIVCVQDRPGMEKLTDNL